jgi:hypothetical protein
LDLAVKYSPPESLKGRLVWRYMTLGRFIWLFQRKALWLSRADRLNDPIETLPSPSEIAKLMTIAVPEVGTSASPYPDEQSALNGLIAVYRGWMEHAYVNCWVESEWESFGMWSTYGRSTESVAIQTTFGKLSDSAPRDGFEVLPVRYDYHVESQVFGPLMLATRKRAEFAYENEIRIIHLIDPIQERERSRPAGFSIAWDPAAHIEHVCVHPNADAGTLETVVETVRSLAPSLTRLVRHSALARTDVSVFLPEMRRVAGLNDRTPSLKADPRTWQQAYVDGLGQCEQRNWDAAITDFWTALHHKEVPQPGRRVEFAENDFRPFNPNYYIGIAHLYLQQFEQADAAFEEVRSQNLIAPTDADFDEFNRYAAAARVEVVIRRAEGAFRDDDLVEALRLISMASSLGASAARLNKLEAQVHLKERWKGNPNPNWPFAQINRKY